MSELTRPQDAGPDTGHGGLPDATLTGRVLDLRALFLNGRQVNSLRNYAAELVRHGVEDDTVAATLTARYQDLRQRIVEVLDSDQLADIEHHVPVCEDGASVPQVAMVADQAACWIEALHEVDGFLLSQQVQAANLETARRKAAADWAAMPPAGTVDRAELAPAGLSPTGYV